MTKETEALMKKELAAARAGRTKAEKKNEELETRLTASDKALRLWRERYEQEERRWQNVEDLNGKMEFELQSKIDEHEALLHKLTEKDAIIERQERDIYRKDQERKDAMQQKAEATVRGDAIKEALTAAMSGMVRG